MTWLNPQTQSEEKVVIVAGGSNGYKYASSVELLNLNQHEEVNLQAFSALTKIFFTFFAKMNISKSTFL